MLYGVSIGPGDPELLTLKALNVIKKADEVIAPGKLAAQVIEGIREPRIVEFPMGKSREVIEELSKELSERCIEEDIAFVALGDVMFYSTFMHVARKVRELNRGVRIECIPGVASFTCAFDRSLVFCDDTLEVITAKDLESFDLNSKFVAVIKATSPKDVAEIGRRKGYRVKAVVRRMYMDGEEIYIDEIPDFQDYFTVVLLERQ